MIESSRAQFNAAFSPERYQQLLAAIHADFQYTPTFRVAETPIFIDANMKSMLLEACQQLLAYIQAPDFKEKSEGALAHAPKVPNENPHPEFLAIDFGLCEENGQLVPKLIEAQGFPSIFNFQYHLYQKFLETTPSSLPTRPSSVAWSRTAIRPFFEKLFWAMLLPRRWCYWK
ncbi:hypothetical protein [Nitritalea halalkaliphila]|uniref:hypothetical protein n=1 Tax=Nitritalea halalkaliphila TaxID=590849 RepID=UPI000310255D|nr:hypothetical protein [Nitritalea halalkaliphila]